MPPALIEFTAYSLDRVFYYVGHLPGMGYSSGKTWNDRKHQISLVTAKELRNISIQQQFYQLLSKMKEIIPDDKDLEIKKCITRYNYFFNTSLSPISENRIIS